MNLLPLFFIISIMISGTAAILIRMSPGRKNAYYPAIKALTTSLIITCSVSALFQNNPGDILLTALITAGLVFSLGGDIAICAEQKSFFLLSVGCFGCAHLLYSTAFFLHTSFSIIALITGVIILGASFSVFRILSTQLKKLKIPVLIYTLVISVSVLLGISMLFSRQLSLTRRIIIAAGAVLFYVSDIVLGINMFSKSKRWLIPLNLFLYYTGQTLLALSCYSFL